MELPASWTTSKLALRTCGSQLTHRRAIRTTNLLERLFVEERRRLKIIPNAFGERAVLNLMFDALIRAAERWRSVPFRAKTSQLYFFAALLPNAYTSCGLISRPHLVALCRVGTPITPPAQSKVHVPQPDHAILGDLEKIYFPPSFCHGIGIAQTKSGGAL